MQAESSEYTPEYTILADVPDALSIVTIRLKAVPGAKRDEIVGVLGDRLKVRVSAPPEGGKANKAICAVLARVLGLKRRDIEIVSGQTHPEKIVRVTGVDAAGACRMLGVPAPDPSGGRRR